MDIVTKEKQWWDAFDSYGHEFEAARPNYDKLDKHTNYWCINEARAGYE